MEEYNVKHSQNIPSNTSQEGQKLRKKKKVNAFDCININFQIIESVLMGN